MQRLVLYMDEKGTELYDVAYDFRRTAEANVLEECLEKFGGQKGSLLDIACGGGQFLVEMKSRGWRVAGIDSSHHMISLARARLGHDTPLRVAAMSDFAAPDKFDAATNWFDSFPYLLTNDEILRHFQCAAGALKDGGLYVLDFSLSRWAEPCWLGQDDGWKPEFKRGWESSRGDMVVYHDGCDGPPCDFARHLITEYMYFRVTARTSGKVDEYCYESHKRALHPQEFAALVTASGVFELEGWFAARRGAFDLSRTLEDAGGKARALVVLRKKLP